MVIKTIKELNYKINKVISKGVMTTHKQLKKDLKEKYNTITENNNHIHKWIKKNNNTNIREDKIEFVNYGIINTGLSIQTEEINKQLEETENYVAIEMYKQFMKDNMKECAKARKQILKNQEVDYFKK